MKELSSSSHYDYQGLQRSALTNQQVLNAIARVCREKFIPVDYVAAAYEDRALPIGFDQTISQPFIVALMSQEAEINPGNRILEIGTGSGFQTAVLMELGATVYSIEIVPELASRAERTLRELSYHSFSLRCGDGWNGWVEQAPFDAILVTAATPKPPPALLEQLKIGGRLILPLEFEEEGKSKDGEILCLLKRIASKDTVQYTTKKLGPVRFVPLIGEGRQ